MMKWVWRCEWKKIRRPLGCKRSPGSLKGAFKETRGAQKSHAGGQRKDRGLWCMMGHWVFIQGEVTGLLKVGIAMMSLWH